MERPPSYRRYLEDDSDDYDDIYAADSGDGEHDERRIFFVEYRVFLFVFFFF